MLDKVIQVWKTRRLKGEKRFCSLNIKVMFRPHRLGVIDVSIAHG